MVKCRLPGWERARGQGREEKASHPKALQTPALISLQLTALASDSTKREFANRQP